ncbi:hypothetical protein ACOSP7_007155 [Xanthoceras sorbifolium]
METLISHKCACCLLCDICSAKSSPAVSIFGDSQVDVGNNCYLDTTAQPFIPNGMILGLILKGINYASTGSGIFSDTGHIFVKLFCSFNWTLLLKTFHALIMIFTWILKSQVDYFTKTKQDIMARIGTRAAQLISYYGYIPPEGKSYHDAYFDKMITEFKSQLICTYIKYFNWYDKNLIYYHFLGRDYYLGAKKILVKNCGSIDYILYVEDTYHNENGYIVPSNQVARYYNSKLKMLLTELTTSLTRSIYVYCDSYAILENIVKNGKTYGKYKQIVAHVIHIGYGYNLCYFSSDHHYLFASQVLKI